MRKRKTKVILNMLLICYFIEYLEYEYENYESDICLPGVIRGFTNERPSESVLLNGF